MPARGSYIDLTGHVYGHWTVVAFAEKRRRLTYWKCQCACGTESLASTGNLRSGQTKSCGCLGGAHRKWAEGKLDRRTCVSCGVAKSGQEFVQKNGLYKTKCCACDAEYQEHRVKAINGYHTRARTINAQARSEALAHYGGKCACCGETEEAFLAFDHIGGGGSQHKKERTRDGATNLPVWLRKHGFPAGFQVLCNNCNWAKFRKGVCPHQVENAVAALSFGA